MLIETLSVFPEMFLRHVHIDLGPRPQGRPF